MKRRKLTHFARWFWVAIISLTLLALLRFGFTSGLSERSPTSLTTTGLIVAVTILFVIIYAERTSRVARHLRRNHPSADIRAIHVRPSQIKELSIFLPSVKLAGFEVRVPVMVTVDGLTFWSRTMPATEVARIPWDAVIEPIGAESTPTTYGHEAAVRVVVGSADGPVIHDFIFGSGWLWGIPRQFSGKMIEYAGALEHKRVRSGS